MQHYNFQNSYDFKSGSYDFNRVVYYFVRGSCKFVRCKNVNVGGIRNNEKRRSINIVACSFCIATNISMENLNGPVNVSIYMVRLFRHFV